MITAAHYPAQLDIKTTVEILNAISDRYEATANTKHFLVIFFFHKNVST